MINVGLFAWAFLILPGVVLTQQSNGSLWNTVYEDYVCDTSDGYLWLADACTFPVRKALNYLLRYGDNTAGLYDAPDYTFNDIPLVRWNENDTIDTNIYDYDNVFPYNQDKICTDYMQLARTCMTHYYSNCSSSAGVGDVNTYIDTYKSQFCDGDSLLSYVDDQRGVLEEFLAGTSRRAQCSGLNDLYDNIVDQTICTDDLILESPYATSNDNITDYTSTDPDSFVDIRDEYANKLMSAFRCMHVEMRSIGCPTSQSQSFIVYTYSQLVPPGVDVTLEDVSRIFIRPEETDAIATGEETDRARTTCGLYGEGHLLRYGRLDDSERLVCTFRRRWVKLLYNSFVNIDAYSTYETATDMGALYFTAVEVSMFDGAGTILMEYSTSNGELSSTYTILDTKTIVSDRASTSNMGMEMMTDDIMQITTPLADLAITISRYGDQYGIWVRGYTADFGRSYGVLTDGCDELDAEQIMGVSLSSLTTRRRRREVTDDCADACDVIEDVDYRYSCYFDCTVNGGNTGTAVGSSQRAQSVQTEYADRADSEMVVGQSGASETRHSTLVLALLIIFSHYFSKL